MLCRFFVRSGSAVELLWATTMDEAINLFLEDAEESSWTLGMTLEVARISEPVMTFATPENKAPSQRYRWAEVAEMLRTTEYEKAKKQREEWREVGIAFAVMIALGVVCGICVIFFG